MWRKARLVGDSHRNIPYLLKELKELGQPVEHTQPEQPPAMVIQGK
jgi:hypothetical protein